MFGCVLNALKRESRMRVRSGKEAMARGELDAASCYFQDAHILGQRFVVEHALSHYWLLRLSLKEKQWADALGQVPRLLTSLIMSPFWVPTGNAGLSSVSAFKSMPIPRHLRDYFEQ